LSQWESCHCPTHPRPGSRCASPVFLLPLLARPPKFKEIREGRIGCVVSADRQANLNRRARRQRQAAWPFGRDEEQCRGGPWLSNGCRPESGSGYFFWLLSHSHSLFAVTHFGAFVYPSRHSLWDVRAVRLGPVWMVNKLCFSLFNLFTRLS
jgi:hypothetical protein